MTDDEIKALALTICGSVRYGTMTMTLEESVAFARAVERATIERAAEVCAYERNWYSRNKMPLRAGACEGVCNRIRALAPNQPSRPVAGNTQE